MRLLPPSLAVLLTLAISCQSSGDKQQATSAGPTAPTATQPATGVAPTFPALPAASALNVRPGVEQQLPDDADLHVLSAKALRVEPMLVALPVLWGSQAPGAVRAVPGYRLSYEAVLEWVPTAGAGEQVPATLALYSPNGRDTLGSFYAGGFNVNVPGRERFSVSQLTPKQPVTVRGTLYTFLSRRTPEKQELLVYPYQDMGGLPDDNKAVYLALPN